MKKTLCLSVSEPWYSLIASGEKTEEYREVKPYWTSRLLGCGQDYTHVLLVNGYGSDRPRAERVIKSVRRGKPRRGWCPREWEDKEVYIIELA